MAKVLAGPIIASASGTIGNVTFEQTKFGLIAQTKPVCHGPWSPAQEAQRDLFRRAHKAWRSLRPNAIQRWRDLATKCGTTPHGPFLSAYMRYLTTGVFTLDASIEPIAPLIITGYVHSPTTIKLYADVTWGPLYHYALGAIIKDDVAPEECDWHYAPGWFSGYGLLPNKGTTPPYLVLLWHYLYDFPNPNKWGALTAVNIT